MGTTPCQIQGPVSNKQLDGLITDFYRNHGKTPMMFAEIDDILEQAFKQSPRNAVKYLQDKGGAIVKTFGWQQLDSAAHSKAFTVSRIENARLLTDIYNAVLKYKSEGVVPKDLKEKILAKITPGRLERVLRVNAAIAQARGKYKQQERLKNVYPYAIYKQRQRANKNPEHAKFHNVIFVVGSSAYKKVFPPKWFGCDCQMINLSETEALELVKKGYKIVDGGELLARNGLKIGNAVTDTDIISDLPLEMRLFNPLDEYNPDTTAIAPRFKAVINKSIAAAPKELEAIPDPVELSFDTKAAENAVIEDFVIDDETKQKAMATYKQWLKDDNKTELDKVRAKIESLKISVKADDADIIAALMLGKDRIKTYTATQETDSNIEPEYKGEFVRRPENTKDKTVKNTNATQQIIKSAVVDYIKNNDNPIVKNNLNKALVNINKIISNSEFMIRVSKYDILKILKSKFKNQFDTHTSGGALSNDTRRDVEFKSFGISKTAEGKDRPIYGMLYDGSNKTNGKQYGSIKVILKDYLKNSTTLTYGDSLDRNFEGTTTFAPAPDSPLDIIADIIQEVSYGYLTTDISNDDENINKTLDMIKNITDLSDMDKTYIECQFHNGVYVDDIKKIILPDYEENNLDLITTLKEMGIPYEFD